MIELDKTILFLTCQASGLGGSFEVTGGESAGTLKPEIRPENIDKTKRCVFLKEIGLFTGPIKDKGETYLIIHGWQSASDESLIAKLAQQIRKVAKPNDRVLLLDWSEAAISSWSAYNGPWKELPNLIAGRNLTAGTWIRPVAEETTKKLRELGIDDNYAREHLHLVGHSLGTLVSEQIGSLYKQNNQHGIKSLIALDPPSETRGKYKIDGRNESLRPGQFQNASPFSRAFVGSQSLAGNQDFTKTAHESIQISFPSLFDLGAEHELVIEAFTTLISQNVFKKPGSNTSLFLLDNYGMGDFVRKNDGYTGVIYAKSGEKFQKFTYQNINGINTAIGTIGDDEINIGKVLSPSDYFDGGFGKDTYIVDVYTPPESGFTIFDPDDDSVIELTTPDEGSQIKVEVNGSKVTVYNTKRLFNGQFHFYFKGKATIRVNGIERLQINSER